MTYFNLPKISLLRMGFRFSTPGLRVFGAARLGCAEPDLTGLLFNLSVCVGSSVQRRQLRLPRGCPRVVARPSSQPHRLFLDLLALAMVLSQ